MLTRGDEVISSHPPQDDSSPTGSKCLAHSSFHLEIAAQQLCSQDQHCHTLEQVQAETCCGAKGRVSVFLVGKWGSAGKDQRVNNQCHCVV